MISINKNSGYVVWHNKEERRESRCGLTGSSGPEECCRCDAHFIWQLWTSCSSDVNPQVLKSETKKTTTTKQPHVTCARVCVAGGVHALPPQDWAHSLHCVLHFWKHMCSVQVSSHNNDNQSDSSSWGWKLWWFYIKEGLCNIRHLCFTVWSCLTAPCFWWGRWSSWRGCVTKRERWRRQ